MTSEAATSCKTATSHSKARRILGWLAFTVVASLNLVFCLSFWLLPALLSRHFTLRWDGWLYGIVLLLLPAPLWFSDRKAPSPLRAAVVTLVAVVLVFVPLFFLQIGIRLLGAWWDANRVEIAALSFLAWAELLALAVLFIPFRGARIDVTAFLKAVVVFLFFASVVLIAPFALFSWMLGGPLLLLACVLLLFVPPRKAVFPKCGAGLLGFMSGAVAALLIAVLFPAPPRMHFDPTFPFFGGILAPAGGLAGILLARWRLKRGNRASVTACCSQ